ncbi:TonB-dependent receptor [Vibrio scophthalmi]|uniref:TonB-dependent receptor plug domain-containing protein n=1 Tax=Vibrio scophthalmi TaxID=45658 RepID=UPI002284056B|nr:TonB-dependent receptor [Vibrio scophthalmi]MCY9802573.1 TonB-dependent receptor [Vibrio scophthalmi]
MHAIKITPLLASLLCTLPAFAVDSLDDLLNMSLTSLAETKVTSATRSSQSLADTPAAVYVITAKEINRSGARSVADALALAPGLHIAKYSNYDWGITARGSNKALSNSLLVMVDGRSVFNPMFSGVDWDLIPVSIDNIEQIEIVLGPVGTTWGGNAVTGVINIITLEAENALEAQLTVKTGNWGYSEYQMRHAGQVSDYAYLSGYFEFVEHPPWTSEQDIVQAIDHFTVYTERFGGRYDYQKLAHTLSIQAGGIRSREDYLWANYHPNAYFPNTPAFTEYDTEMTMEEYFVGTNHIYETQNGNSIESDIWLTYSSNDSTARDATYYRFDLDSRWNSNDLWGTQLTIGGNVRLINEELATYSTYDKFTMPYLRITDDPTFFNESYGIYSNWNIPLSDSTNLMMGNRWQYNNISDEVDAQPQIRLSQKLTNNQSLWFGWGKAVVTPSRLERDTYFKQNTVLDCNVPPEHQSPWCGKGTGNQDDVYIVTGQFGNDKLKTEIVETYELGYRFWQDDRLNVSLSTYYSIHDNVRSYLYTNIYLDWSNPETLIVSQGSIVTDSIWTETYGGEISAKWQPLDQLQINTNYSYKRIIGHCQTSLCSNYDKRKIENEPNHFINAQIMWDINEQWWANATLQYVGKSQLHQDYKPTGPYDYTWPEVVNLDLSLSWKYNQYSPRITATVEGVGANQDVEFAESMGPFQNGTQYWVTVEWAVAQEI